MAPRTRASLKNPGTKRLKKTKIIDDDNDDNDYQDDDYKPDDDVVDEEKDSDDEIHDDDDDNDNDSEFEPDEKEILKKRKSNGGKAIKRTYTKSSKKSSSKNSNTKKKQSKISKLNGNHEVSDNIVTDQDQSDDEDENDWEEVQDNDFDLDDYNPNIPDQIQITLKQPDTSALKKERSKLEWIYQCIRCDMNHQRKNIQLNAHRVHLLLFIHRLKYLNSIINSDLMIALIMSCKFFQDFEIKNKPTKNKKKPLKYFTAEEIFEWLQNYFKISFKTTKKVLNDIEKEIQIALQNDKIDCQLILYMIMAGFMRSLKMKVRLCYLLDPVPIKPLDLLTKKTKFIRNKEEPLPIVQTKLQDPIDCYWLEIFDINLKKWITFNVNLENHNESLAIAAKLKRKLKNISYVLAIDNDGYITDVTQRYCPNWFSYERIKNRIDEELYDEIMALVKRPKMNAEEKADKIEFEKMQADCEFPKRFADYKNHPLFALKRHILKFQALYPPDLPPLGFFNDEPIYSRDCVYTLKSRETWLRDARTVMPNEKPYKIELSKFKKIKPFTNGEAERQPLELFGEWQTKPYEPPVAKNGIVPRNGFGNVDLFQESMLPIGTVLLRLPGIARIAAKMNIDCAPAIVGFDNNKKGIGSHPIIDGFVVCKEFEQKLIKAWNENNEIQMERAKNDREKRIYGNWRKLIRGLIIRNNIKIKYGN